MSVTIGEACYDENGNITNGKGGDQTGKEVALNPYRAGFTIAYRCKDEKKRLNIAEACLQATMNNNIGYSQNDRYSMYQQMLKTGNILKIAVPCNTDCSQLVASCCIIAGVPITPYMSTSSEDKILMETGMFDKITSFTAADLRKGDILWKQGHTCVVVVADEKPAETVKYIAEATQYCFVWADTSKTVRASYPALGEGNKMEVLDEDGRWYMVRIAGKHIGYVEKTLKRV